MPRPAGALRPFSGSPAAYKILFMKNMLRIAFVAALVLPLKGRAVETLAAPPGVDAQLFSSLQTNEPLAFSHVVSACDSDAVCWNQRLAAFKHLRTSRIDSHAQEVVAALPQQIANQQKSGATFDTTRQAAVAASTGAAAGTSISTSTHASSFPAASAIPNLVASSTATDARGAKLVEYVAKGEKAALLAGLAGYVLGGPMVMLACVLAGFFVGLLVHKLGDN